MSDPKQIILELRFPLFVKSDLKKKVSDVPGCASRGIILHFYLPSGAEDLIPERKSKCAPSYEQHPCSWGHSFCKQIYKDRHLFKLKPRWRNTPLVDGSVFTLPTPTTSRDTWLNTAITKGAFKAPRAQVPPRTVKLGCLLWHLGISHFLKFSLHPIP